MSRAGAAAGRWRVQAASVAGSAHRARGQVCQDAHLAIPAGEALIAAVADGAGSAARADEGARRAVLAAALAAAAWAPWLESAEGATAAAARWMDMARGALPGEGEAGLAELATTLAVAVISPALVTVAQIGDGLVVVRRDGQWELVDGPPRGEYLNETTFLTSPRWRRAVRVSSQPATEIDAVALISDGLQLVAVDLEAERPHAPFFGPLAEFVTRPDADPAELAEFLASERMCARTDDDKTLVMAVRDGGT